MGLLSRYNQYKVRKKFTDGTYNFNEITKCFCESNSFKKIASNDKYNLPVVFSKCDNCKAIIQSKRLIKNDLELFFRYDYRNLVRGTKNIDINYFDRGIRRGEKILSYMTNNSVEIANKNVLEIGSGSGGILSYFKSKGSKVIGFDLDENCVNYSNYKNIETYVGDINTVLDGKICADIIILSHLIQHLDNPKKFLKLLYDHVIVDGGYIYLEVPGIKRIDFQKERQVSHLWYWNLNNLKMLMNKIGFDMVTGDESIQSIFIR